MGNRGLRRAWYENRNKVTAWLERNCVGLPSIGCKLIGDAMYNSVKAAAKAGASTSHAVDQLTFEEGDSRLAVFGCPKKIDRILPESALNARTTDMHIAVEKFLETHLAAIKERKVRQDRCIQQEKREQVIGTLDVGSEFFQAKGWDNTFGTRRFWAGVD